MSDLDSSFNPVSSFRERLRVIIFEAETPAGKQFDVWLLIFICLSVGAVMAESVESLRAQWASHLRVAEWVFTGLFTIEYALRLYSSRRAWRYARSFFGVVDLISILPTYLTLLLVGSQYLAVLRLIRLVRMFRILKMVRFVGEGQVLLVALKRSMPKITVFLLSVFIITTVMGTILYLVESAEAGFTSIPTSIYWAIVTVTTVGYGDISPQTPFGQIIASIGMLTGYAIIAVPTGIVGVELSRASAGPDDRVPTEVGPPCVGCGQKVHRRGAQFCDRCGTPIAKI